MIRVTDANFAAVEDYTEGLRDALKWLRFAVDDARAAGGALKCEETQQISRDLSDAKDRLQGLVAEYDNALGAAWAKIKAAHTADAVKDLY